MTTQQQPVAQGLRIGAEEVKSRLQSGEAMTILDVRNDRPWQASPVKIRGAVRIEPGQWHIDPSWSKGQLTVVY